MSFEYLKSYVSAKYPALQVYITEAQYEQIDWVDKPVINQTNEFALAPQVDRALSFQQQRLLARLYFLDLLRKANYRDFVIGQDVEGLPALTEAPFFMLSQIIQNLTETEYQQLWVASITSISKTASTLAEENFSSRMSSDSVVFLAKVMSEMPEIYPAASEIITTDSTAADAFKIMFNTGHFRHMMYVEGDSTMFLQLRKKIVEGFDQKQLNLWFAYWLIDITAFRLHTKEGLGSEYLRQNTAQAILLLKTQLDTILTDPNKPILRDYLEERARWVSSDLPYSSIASSDSRILLPRIVLGRLASLLRLYTPMGGLEIQQGLHRLKENQRYLSMIDTLNPLIVRDEPTPTFAPALLANLYNRTKSYETAIFLGLPLLCEALEKYRALPSISGEKFILNLNGLASSMNIDKILSGAPLEVNINEKGETDLKESPCELLAFHDVVPRK